MKIKFKSLKDKLEDYEKYMEDIEQTIDLHYDQNKSAIKDLLEWMEQVEPKVDPSIIQKVKNALEREKLQIEDAWIAGFCHSTDEVNGESLAWAVLNESNENYKLDEAATEYYEKTYNDND